MVQEAGLYDETPVGIVDLTTLPQQTDVSKSEPSWVAEIPVNDEALTSLPTSHPKIKDAPDHIYKYVTTDGEYAFEVWRWNAGPRREKKIIQPLSFGHERGSDVTDWAWHFPPSPRPLYNLQEIADRADATVLLVAGEKAVEAVRHNPYFSGFVPCTWASGESSILLNDWTPLAGRKVIFWPDNDEPGKRCALGYEGRNKKHVKGLVEILNEDIGAICVSVDPPSMLPEGWDLADPLPPGIDPDGPLRYLESRYVSALNQKAKEHKASPKVNGTNGASHAPVASAIQVDVAASFEYRPPEDVIVKCSEYDLNDTGNALRILAYKPNSILWVPEYGYLAWDGKRWLANKEKAVQISQLALSSIRYEVGVVEGTERKAHEKFSVQALNMGQVKAALEALQPHAMMDVSGLNTSLSELNTQSGVVDLRTGAIKPHHPTQYNTHITPVSVAPPGTEAPMFKKFLSRILPDEEIRGYVQRMMGYFLTGITSEQSFFFWYGQGGNGKGELIKIIQGIMGDGYCRSELPTVLMDKTYNQGVEIAIGRMLGARLIVTSEPSSNFTLAEGTVKLLTGQDKLAGRKLYREGFNFDPTHKIMMNGNHKPRVKSGDEGTWRRIKLIPFDAQIGEHEKVDNISALIIEKEGPAVLRWAIEGAQQWFSQRLAAPDSIRKEIAAYKEEENTVLQWINDACEYDATEFRTTKELYENYRGWCTTNFYTMLGPRMFAVRMKENKNIKAFRGPQARGYHGLKLRQPDLSYESGGRQKSFGLDDDD